MLAGVANASPSTFAERVSVAKEVEKDPTADTYLQHEMYPVVGPALATAMRKCLARHGANTKAFTLVATVNSSGELQNVDHQPNTNTAICMATALKSMRVPPPRTCDREELPVEFEMQITQ